MKRVPKRARRGMIAIASAVGLVVAAAETGPRALAQTGGPPTTTSTTIGRVTTTTTTTTTTTLRPTTTRATTSTTQTPKPTTTKPGPTIVSPGTTSPDPTAPGQTFPLGVSTTSPGASIKANVTAAELRVPYLEVTQGMQNLLNDMPLVVGRTTLVRAYVRTDGGNATGVRGILGGWFDGNYLGAIAAENQPITAQFTGGSRVNTNDSLYFVLPPSWVKGGGVTHLRVFVYQSSVAFTQQNEDKLSDNFRSEYLTFKTSQPLRVVMPPLHFHTPAIGGSDNTFYLLPNLGTVVSVMQAAKRYFPTGEFQFFSPQTPLFPSMHAGGGEWDIGEDSMSDQGNRLVPLATVLSTKDASNQSTWEWYAMISPTQPYTRYNDDGTISNVGGSSSGGVSQGKMSNTFSAGSPWSHNGGVTLAHEMTHNLGQSHVNCAGTESLGGGIDPNFPTPAPNCSLAKVDVTGYYGFDVLYQSFPETPEPIVISNKPDIGAPNEAYPLMSYSGPGYTDPYAWCKLLVEFGVSCSAYPEPDDGLDLEQGQGPRVRSLHGARLVAQSSGLAVRVTGIAHRGTGEARLLEVAVRDDLPDKKATASDRKPEFRVEALDESGEVVGGRVVDGHDDAAHLDEVDPSFVFSEVIPVTARPTSVRITRDGVTVASRSASAAPTVRLVSPNGGETLDGPVQVAWEASDSDSRALDAEISYSADGGKTWRVITTGLGGSSFTIPAADLGGSQTGRIRVAVNDGFTTATDASDADFTVANQAPNVAAILSPAAGRVFRLHETVVFRAMVSDWENPDRFTVRWSSDVDGDLGRGIEVHAGELSAGKHVITMTATDADGATAAATVPIEIDGSNAADRPSADDLALATELISDEGGDGFPVLPVALAVIAAAVAAAVFVRLRLRRRSAAEAPAQE